MRRLDAASSAAAFASASSDAGISCNVIAAYYHDPIFVSRVDADRAMRVLWNLSDNGA
ncbi:ACT domain-containing protein [Pseudomonas sp. MWU16-30317]|uniref:ACT domain-containing protein n=1 Tax=Pseudomonas sp. MWU16-30317 TaxID=2878095 RepID=UPI0031F8DEE5